MLSYRTFLFYHRNLIIHGQLLGEIVWCESTTGNARAVQTRGVLTHNICTEVLLWRRRQAHACVYRCDVDINEFETWAGSAR